MDVLIFIEVEQKVNGGYISDWIIKNHLNRFLIGADARDLNLLYDQMYRAAILVKVFKSGLKLHIPF